MKTKNKTIKSILGCASACSALMLGGVGAMNLNNTANYNVSAYGVDNISVNITNSSFNNSTSSNYPFSPSGYSAYNHNNKVSSTSNVEDNVQAGVINLSNENYKSRFSLAKRTSLDDYVLMIDSTDKDNNSVMHNVNYGFRTNSGVSLEENSKYMVTVDVFSATNSNIASLYLYDGDGNEFSSIEKIGSYNEWTTYSFFVSTNNVKKTTLTIGMYLDGAGTVLFDNLSAFKMSDKEYNFTMNSATNGTYAEKNSVDNTIESYSINSVGQLVSSNGEISNFNAVEYEFNSKHSLSYTQDSDGKNNHAVLLENKEATFASYETENIITLEPNRVYQVSVAAKTKDLDGTATLTLERTDIDKDDDNYNANHNKTISITTNSYSSSTESVTNDYSSHSFYIVSHPSKTTTYKLVFGLGSEDALATGKLYLSEVKINKINYETYTSATSSNQISLVNAYKNSSIMLNNGDFNAFKIADYNAPVPAAPLDWEVTAGKNNQKYGVVNTASFETDLSSLNLSNLKNPSSEKNNNVLMMYNETADSLTYISTSKTLKAKSYNKFEIDVQTQNASLLVELVTNKDEQEIVLTSKTINTTYAWETITMFLHAGYQDLDVSLKLSLNTSDYGYAYVDNAKFNYALTATQVETQFNATAESQQIAKVDLGNILANSTNDKFAQTTLFTGENVTGVESGMITLNSNYIDEVVDGENNIEIFNSIAGEELDKKALSIWSTDEVYYTLTSNIGYNLSSGSYYKISVDVFTQNIATNNGESSDNIGAGIGLTEFDNAFVNIKSNNVWTTYTFYIKAEKTATSYLELSLGNENANAKGCVFFTNITFDDSITETEYNSIHESSITKILTTKTESTESDTDTDNKTEETTENGASSNWIYLIPSLLTVLSVIIAVVGLLMRKIKWKNLFKKKSKTSYDRNKTVSIQYYTRKATTLREDKVRELTQDLIKVQEDRKKYENQYKENLTKLREMKIKRANPADIAKFEKEIKKAQKMSSSLGVSANKISEELKYAQTDMYLNSLIKKLAREGSSKEETEETNK